MQQSHVVKDELIGKTVTIKECTDPTWENVSGVIVDETQHTLVIETKGQRRRIAKGIATFVIDVKGTPVPIQGSRLQYRPEERIKKAR